MLAFILFSRKSTQICQNCCWIKQNTRHSSFHSDLPPPPCVSSKQSASWPTLNQPLCLINKACWIVVFFFSNSFFWFAHSLCPLSLIPGWLVSLINNTLTGSKVKILICSSHLSFYKAACFLAQNGSTSSSHQYRRWNEVKGQSLNLFLTPIPF